MAGEDKNPQQLSRKQIVDLYKAGPEAMVSLVEYLQESIQRLSRRIHALELQVNKNSRNSDKPPSSDGLKKKPPRKRKASGKKPGGQEGHEGTTLQMSADPDKSETHEVECCGNCGCSLKDKQSIGYDRRQVFDAPPIAVEVTEHRAEIKECDKCGTVSTATFPEGITHTVQYGERLKAIALYLKNYGLLPYDRTAELFEDLFGIPISPGTLVRINTDSGKRLGEVSERIKEALRSSAVVHCDETGMRIGGKLHWLHVASTSGLTYYLAHKRRGSGGIDEMGILPFFEGKAVHDGWRSYFNYLCGHGLCNAHHLRELTCVYEDFDQQWAKQMIDFLLDVKERRDKSKGKSFAGKTIAGFEQRYREILKMGMEANPPPPDPPGKRKRGPKKKSKPLNLVERLRDHEEATLAFMYDFCVPFDNNQAERDIRMMKVQQKISGTFRSFDGALSFCAIRGYISTARKQGLNVISALQEIFSGRPLLPNIGLQTAE
mgnify:CR=1 FL=1